MDDKSRALPISEQSLEEQALSERREFLKKAARAAVTVPAVALLLSTKARSARADTISGLDTIGIK